MLDDIGIKLTEKQVFEIINSLDLNRNGEIDYTEFLAGCMKSKVYLRDEYLKLAFSYFDKVSF